MPVHKEHQWEHFKMLIWKIDPNEEIDLLEEELSPADQKRLKSLKHPKRRLEFLCARQALLELIGVSPYLEYTEKGAPQIEGYAGISISHNQDYAAVILSKEHKVGLDLEAYRPQMEKLHARYMSKQELKCLGKEDNLEMLAAFWCAKECLIKLLDAPDLDLRRQIRVSPFPKGQSAMSKALVLRGNVKESFPLYFKLEKDYCLCFSFH